MREHGCAVAGFVIGMPMVAAGYVIVNKPSIWFAFLDILTVVLVVLWILVTAYLTLLIIAWLKHRREARTVVEEPTYRPQAQHRSRGKQPVEQGRDKPAATGQGFPTGGQRVL